MEQTQYGLYIFKVTVKNNTIEYNIEGLRGIAAFTVVVGHLLYHKNYLDPAFEMRLPGDYMPPGHFSVLIFFCLSGFVIGVSNQKPLSGWKEISSYFKKRLIRLYPIYLVSVLIMLPFAFSFNMQNVALVLKYLTFTNLVFAEGYPYNTPLWSLNYEMLYYLLFIPLSFLRFPRYLAIFLALSVALINIKMESVFCPPLLSSYLFGLVFWLAGLKISEFNFRKRTDPVSLNLVLSSFLLFLIIPSVIGVITPFRLTNYFSPAESIPWVFRAIKISDLMLLPFCLYFITILANIEFKARRYIIVLAYLFPLVAFIIMMIKGSDFQKILMPFGLYITSAVLVLIKRSAFTNILTKIKTAIIYAGGISYAVYVMHYPLLLLFRSVTEFTGTWLTMLIRLALYLALLIMVSVLLEKYMQPSLKRWFAKKKSPSKIQA